MIKKAVINVKVELRKKNNLIKDKTMMEHQRKRKAYDSKKMSEMSEKQEKNMEWNSWNPLPMYRLMSYSLT